MKLTTVFLIAFAVLTATFGVLFFTSRDFVFAFISLAFVGALNITNAVINYQSGNKTAANIFLIGGMLLIVVMVVGVMTKM